MEIRAFSFCRQRKELRFSGDNSGTLWIRKNLTTHTAGHSYATSVCLANGGGLENVVRMPVHSNIKMTQHCARVLDSSILRDMMQVKRSITRPG